MASRTLSSPIPNDPTEWVTDTHFYERQSTTYAPRGRVRPEAEQIAMKSRNGTVARLFSIPDQRTPRYKREKFCDVYANGNISGGVFYLMRNLTLVLHCCSCS